MNITAGVEVGGGHYSSCHKDRICVSVDLQVQLPISREHEGQRRMLMTSKVRMQFSNSRLRISVFRETTGKKMNGMVGKTETKANIKCF